MTLVVKLLSGPGAGRSTQVEAGQSRRFGQAKDFCDLAFEWDTHASLAHFDVAAQGEEWLVRDLGTFAGTFLNGAKVSGEMPVKPGDRILAGRTLLGVSSLEEDDQEQPADRAVGLFRRIPEPLFVVLDSARDGRIAELLGACDGGCVNLFQGQDGAALAQFAPYLVELRKDSPFFEMLVREAWGKKWGVFLTSYLEIFELRFHMRRLLTVTNEQGRKLLFRYYDPSILRVYLPTCSPAEWQDFFGPVKRFLTESEDAQQLLVFNQETPGPPRPLSIEK
jgi:hypothetical protein